MLSHCDGAEDGSSHRTTVAIVAHDGKKADLTAWAMFNRGTLEQYDLLATQATGNLLQAKVGLEVETVLSGPQGGDAQIAARVVDGRVDFVFFFVDPLDKHPHEPDIQTLLRVCNVHNVPIATNLASADLIIASNGLRCTPDQAAPGAPRLRRVSSR